MHSRYVLDGSCSNTVLVKMLVLICKARCSTASSAECPWHGLARQTACCHDVPGKIGMHLFQPATMRDVPAQQQDTKQQQAMPGIVCCSNCMCMLCRCRVCATMPSTSASWRTTAGQQRCRRHQRYACHKHTHSLPATSVPVIQFANKQRSALSSVCATEWAAWETDVLMNCGLVPHSLESDKHANRMYKQ
jgi:hypothetical protein